MGSGITFVINGKDITTPKSLNLGVTKDAKKIPTTVIDTVTGAKKKIELNFAYDGDLGMTIALSANLGTQYNGDYANLMLYNPDTKKLEA